MSKSKTVLVTAFEAFGGESINPTQIVLEKLPESIDGYQIKKVLLPVEFTRCRQMAFEEYNRCLPAAVIMLGQAGGREAITPESTGRNIMQARIPDNAGYCPDRLPVVENGPDILDSTFPVSRIVEAINSIGVKAKQSDDAGTYVCNTLLYGMLEHDKGEVPTGFIHVPYIREQGHPDKPFMELADILRAVETAIRTVIDNI